MSLLHLQTFVMLDFALYVSQKYLFHSLISVAQEVSVLCKHLLWVCARSNSLSAQLRQVTLCLSPGKADKYCLLSKIRMRQAARDLKDDIWISECYWRYPGRVCLHFLRDILGNDIHPGLIGHIPGFARRSCCKYAQALLKTRVLTHILVTHNHNCTCWADKKRP